MSKLAKKLVELDLPFESRVAIAVNRSAEMIIGLLGILKAGLAYVPIDPNYPNDRINFLISDSGAKVLLTHRALKSQFSKSFEGKILGLDKFLFLAPKPKFNIDLPVVEGNQLAYSIYTSGSTGKPKGVLIEHHSVINLVKGQSIYVKQDVERFLYAYSFSFDGSVLLTWWTLLTGGTLVMTKDGLEKDINLLVDFLADKKITHLLTFPSLYQLVLNNGNMDKLSSLKSISVAGEACPGKLVKAHFHHLPQVRLFNQYGPTEATVGCTIYETTATHKSAKTPIGWPIAGANIYILNKDLKRVENGEIGEICIGGKGVARGYHNNGLLTNRQFINIEFDGITDRIYKSGDLGRVLEDGAIDFCGRVDTQIKLRGYRIELGEIEASIKQIEGVQEVVVVLTEGNTHEQKLVAYCQVQNDIELKRVREVLIATLPEYMIPSLWVQVEKFGLTPAGKIDRNNLPKPGNHRPDLDNSFVAPTNELEEFLQKKWESTLGISGIGIKDKFFELGGNSLLAASFISELQQLFKIHPSEGRAPKFYSTK